MSAFELDPNLREFATDRQWELLTAWHDHSSQRLAAAALSVDDRLISQAWSRVLKKAARAGYMPDNGEFAMASRVPAGFVLKGQSAFVDDNGKLQARWDKTKQAGIEPEDERTLPDPKKVVSLSTMRDADGKAIVQWTKEKPEDGTRERLWREFAHQLSRDIPRLEPLPRLWTESNDSLLAGIPVGDHHMGMLSWHHETGADYDLKIAEDLLTGAVDHLFKATGPAGTALVAFLGDFLHYDSFETVTPTSRNQLDADSRFPKMVHAAVRTMRYVLDMALRHYGYVRVIVEPGNHDLSTSIFLALCLKIAYEKEPRLEVDTSPAHYHYYRFGQVLLGTHHGHGTKMQNLPLTMAADRPDDWGATRHRHWWTGHIHHSKTQAAVSAQDFSGCTVESFRILAPGDAWSHQKGYRAARDMKAIVYHAEHGEVARHTVNPRMLEGLTSAPLAAAA